MASKSPSTNPEQRVIVWGMARSLSTVFEKCMSFVDGVQIINEPFQCASVIGPEGYLGKQNLESEMRAYMDETGLPNFIEESKDNAGQGWDDRLCTFQWVKEMLEGDFPGKKLVFSKDLITGIHGKYDYIPKGYQHTFIIRNPVKVLVSQRRLMVSGGMIPQNIPPDQFDMAQVPFWKMCPAFGFGEMLEFIEHLKKIGEIQTEPILIDADDLQNHPESIISQYCEKTGITFNKSLLTWEAGDGVVKRNWIISQGFIGGNQLMNYYAAAFKSTGFQPAKDPPASLTPDVVKMAEIAEPYYRKLYEMRIKP